MIKLTLLEVSLLGHQLHASLFSALMRFSKTHPGVSIHRRSLCIGKAISRRGYALFTHVLIINETVYTEVISNYAHKDERRGGNVCNSRLRDVYKKQVC